MDTLLYNSKICSPKEFTSIFPLSNKSTEGESTPNVILIRAAALTGISAQKGISIGADAERNLGTEAPAVAATTPVATTVVITVDVALIVAAAVAVAATKVVAVAPAMEPIAAPA